MVFVQIVIDKLFWRLYVYFATYFHLPLFVSFSFGILLFVNLDDLLGCVDTFPLLLVVFKPFDGEPVQPKRSESLFARLDLVLLATGVGAVTFTSLIS